MRPIQLQGHHRAVTMVKYNREGDLLFSTAKDKVPTVWSAETGERLGTYEGHAGAVWGCDVNAASTMLATAGADQTTRIWNVETGTLAGAFQARSPARSVAFSHGDLLLAVASGGAMGEEPVIRMYANPFMTGAKPVMEWKEPQRVTCVVFGPSNNEVYVSSVDGMVKVLDVRTGGRVLAQERVHELAVRSIRWDDEWACLLTAGGADRTSKLLDVDLNTLRTYIHPDPVNDACMAPSDGRPHVLLAGGDAETTAFSRNTFATSFVHKITTETLGAISGHFGPVNALAFEPNGYGFCSGGEDGYLRLHHFDSDYFDPDNYETDCCESDYCDSD